jgi:serine/threonine protein kinase
MPYLADFGLALTVQDSTASQTTRGFAVGGIGAGTIAYLAPELMANVQEHDVEPGDESQVGVSSINSLGKSQSIGVIAAQVSDVILGTPASARPSPITDCYSLGVILWELFTIQVPWKGAGAPRILMAHLQNITLPIQDEQENAPNYIPRWIAPLVRRMLGPPAGRPSAAEALTHLKNYLASL